MSNFASLDEKKIIPFDIIIVAEENDQNHPPWFGRCNNKDHY
jgi:hypothetical protein